MEKWAEGLLWCQDYKHGQDFWGGSGVGTKANGLPQRKEPTVSHLIMLWFGAGNLCSGTLQV